jgi:hypothetical protein
MSEQVVAIDAGVLADWLAKNAADAFWTVDGETNLEGQLDLRCTGSDLAEAVRKHGGELLALVPHHGSRRSDAPGALAVKEAYGGRVFQLAWKSDPNRPWVVAEDVEAEPARAASPRGSR